MRSRVSYTSVSKTSRLLDEQKQLNTVDAKLLTHSQAGILSRCLKRKILNQESVDDDSFDLVFPPGVRQFSGIHFTPLVVALKAAQILKHHQVEQVLDVGSGCGKFCIVAGMASGLFVTGVEQREFLSKAAVKAKNAFELPNVSFICGSAFDLDWKQYDCIYFFNPFCEQKVPERRMNNDLDMNESIYHTYVQMSHARLRAQKKGSLVLTYHGLGGAMPDEYSLSYQKAIGSDFLKLWIKDS